MQADRSAGAARLAGRVRGLGVCDVLRVELVASQGQHLIDAMSARAVALEERRTGLEAMARTQTSSSQVDSELGEVCEALALLALIRAGVEEPERGAIVFAGPAGMVLELVDGALVAAAADLAVALRDGLRGTPWGECEARLEVAAAWITTTLECHAIETYCFDCSADPVHAW